MGQSIQYLWAHTQTSIQLTNLLLMYNWYINKNSLQLMYNKNSHPSIAILLKRLRKFKHSRIPYYKEMIKHFYKKSNEVWLKNNLFRSDLPQRTKKLAGEFKICVKINKSQPVCWEGRPNLLNLITVLK